MEKLPKEMTICTLEVLVTKTGEILCEGCKIGVFRKLKESLEVGSHKKGGLKMTDATMKRAVFLLLEDSIFRMGQREKAEENVDLREHLNALIAERKRCKGIIAEISTSEAGKKEIESEY